MLIKTRALVLRTVRYGEQNLVVDMLTRSAGRQTFFVRTTKTGRGMMKKQLLQPMSLLDIEFDLKQNASMRHLSNLQLSRPWTTLQNDAVKVPVTLFIAEFLTYATGGEVVNEPLFDYLEQGLAWLDMATDNYANFHLVLLMRLSLFLGFSPDTESYADHALFDLRNGVFSLRMPSHPDYLDERESEAMHQLLRLNFETMHLFRMNRQQRNRCLDVILYFYRIHIPSFPEMKALPILRELFG